MPPSEAQRPAPSHPVIHQVATVRRASNTGYLQTRPRTAGILTSPKGPRPKILFHLPLSLCELAASQTLILSSGSRMYRFIESACECRSEVCASASVCGNACARNQRACAYTINGTECNLGIFMRRERRDGGRHDAAGKRRTDIKCFLSSRC